MGVDESPQGGRALGPGKRLLAHTHSRIIGGDGTVWAGGPREADSRAASDSFSKGQGQGASWPGTTQQGSSWNQGQNVLP